MVMTGRRLPWRVGLGQAITQRQAKTLAETKNVPVNWDAVHKVPHFSYTDLGNRHVVYFEDRYSLSHKLYLVNKHDLAGTFSGGLASKTQPFGASSK